MIHKIIKIAQKFQRHLRSLQLKKLATNEIPDVFIKLKDLSQKMFEIDESLTEKSANWNHNLAYVFKTWVKIKKRKPDYLKKMLEKFDANDWLERGQEPLIEIKSEDSQLAEDIIDMIYHFQSPEDDSEVDQNDQNKVDTGKKVHQNFPNGYGLIIRRPFAGTQFDNLEEPYELEVTFNEEQCSYKYCGEISDILHPFRREISPDVDEWEADMLYGDPFVLTSITWKDILNITEQIKNLPSTLDPLEKMVPDDTSPDEPEDILPTFMGMGHRRNIRGKSW